MAWRRPGDKPLSEPMMVSLKTHICVTRPQWVNVSIVTANPTKPAVCTRLNGVANVIHPVAIYVCCDSLKESVLHTNVDVIEHRCGNKKFDYKLSLFDAIRNPFSQPRLYNFHQIRKNLFKFSFTCGFYPRRYACQLFGVTHTLPVNEYHKMGSIEFQFYTLRFKNTGLISKVQTRFCRYTKDSISRNLWVGWCVSSWWP